MRVLRTRVDRSLVTHLAAERTDCEEARATHLIQTSAARRATQQRNTLSAIWFATDRNARLVR